MIVAGIGCRLGCPASEIAALVRRALESTHCDASALAAPDFRAKEANVWIAAEDLALPLLLVDRHELAAAQERCVTRSEWAKHATGLSSVAEAAALAAAGPGSTLLLPRIANASATCALARAASP